MTMLSDVMDPEALAWLQRGPTPPPEAPPPGSHERRAQRHLYGQHFSIRRWEQRTPNEQEFINKALAAFQRWRIREGEDIPHDSLWDVPPPSADILLDYLDQVSYNSRCWRDRTVAALRLYFLHVENPTLFRLVEVELAK